MYKSTAMFEYKIETKHEWGNVINRVSEHDNKKIRGFQIPTVRGNG